MKELLIIVVQVFGIRVNIYTLKSFENWNKNAVKLVNTYTRQ